MYGAVALGATTSSKASIISSWSKTSPGNHKCDVQNLRSVIHLATQRPDRKIGLVEGEGMRTNSSQLVLMCFQYLKRG